MEDSRLLLRLLPISNLLTHKTITPTHYVVKEWNHSLRLYTQAQKSIFRPWLCLVSLLSVVLSSQITWRRCKLHTIHFQLCNLLFLLFGYDHFIACIHTPTQGSCNSCSSLILSAWMINCPVLKLAHKVKDALCCISLNLLSCLQSQIVLQRARKDKTYGHKCKAYTPQ